MPFLDEVDAKVAGFDFSRHRDLELETDQHLGTIWEVGPVVGQAADAASTLYVLNRLRGKAVEGNPAVRVVVGDGQNLARNAIFVAGKLGMGAGFAFAAHKLAGSGHLTSAKVFSSLATAAGVGAAVHNLSLR